MLALLRTSSHHFGCFRCATTRLPLCSAFPCFALFCLVSPQVESSVWRQLCPQLWQHYHHFPQRQLVQAKLQAQVCVQTAGEKGDAACISACTEGVCGEEERCQVDCSSSSSSSSSSTPVPSTLSSALVDSENVSAFTTAIASATEPHLLSSPADNDFPPQQTCSGNSASCQLCHVVPHPGDPFLRRLLDHTRGQVARKGGIDVSGALAMFEAHACADRVLFLD